LDYWSTSWLAYQQKDVPGMKSRKKILKNGEKIVYYKAEKMASESKKVIFQFF